CLSDHITWETLSGRGKLHTYVINHRAAPGFEAPYAIAVVELDEGPRMMSNIIDVEQTPEALVIDMPLEVTFEQRDDISVPVFRPAATTGGAR
ncbi:MAG: Zn-ribbon domain-containing OB-fold protein, partial [Acidimicrobiales bacterium]